MKPQNGWGQRRLRVSAELLEKCLLNGATLSADLPNDVQFARVWPNDDERTYVVVLESQEWHELEEGEKIPLHKPFAEKI